ncbi:CHAPERONE PROTEIN DNAJ C76 CHLOROPLASTIC [Salix viminalis]|uniref:CHAPERONE PROTEIN DNAJ C76 CHLOROPLASTIC n=1 Tax=Salix viminalis TaxID=40686 RepID=A0A9Q0SHZ0_SALVM|nr:CHAPERONE PROTEIN DNAJ C76 CHLOROPLASTIC [Salix viminalis]
METTNLQPPSPPQFCHLFFEESKMPAGCLPFHSPFASIITKNLTPKTFPSFSPTLRKTTCRATSSSSSSISFSSITDFDLYDLLGIDSSSDHSQIRKAYRTLQKRCHPDIAGPAGHDMAIILNEAYAVLSDPNSRLAYDKEQAKIAELSGYSGKPIYSAWFGSESEQRAVFVDEVKCIGCLKCALIAEKTFAIESVYGRARVVAQWADPEHKINAAIDACPVDCISTVERADLAALEFLMSKQPRGTVRVGSGNAAGGRVSNIFIDVKKFQDRLAGAMNKATAQNSMEDQQREARITAFQAIRSISNWLYWQSPRADSPESYQKLTRIVRKSPQPNINKILEAAAARKKARESTRPFRQAPSSSLYYEEYWSPSTQSIPSSINSSSSSSSSRSTPETSRTKESKKLEKDDRREDRRQTNPIRWGIPMVPATIAAVIIHLQVGEGTIGGLNEHVGGSFALGIVNSSWLQVILAGITWYLIGAAMIGVVEAILRGISTKQKGN